MELYSRERIPKNPVLSFRTFEQTNDVGVTSVLDVGEARYVNRGCMAIGLALQHARVAKGDEVLLPAYHCISMIEPVIWRGAQPVFYRINEDTSVNLTDIESRISTRTRVLLVTHYFGFPQDTARIRALCDQHGLLLIEDCAHAFFGSAGGAPIGSFGDYAIASAWKFFPIFDGGLIVSARRNLEDIELESPGMRFHAKAAVNCLERAFEYRRLPVIRQICLGPLWLKDFVLRQLRSGDRAALAGSCELTRSLGNWGFDPSLVHNKTSVCSRLVIALASRSRIVERRRRNYRLLQDALGRLQGCHPLFPQLPDGVIPQVFPLVFDVPGRAFQQLKTAGVPIIRFGEYLWEGMPVSTCLVSAQLSQTVFQFPCHQELLDCELDWMIDKIKLVGAAA